MGIGLKWIKNKYNSIYVKDGRQNKEWTTKNCKENLCGLANHKKKQTNKNWVGLTVLATHDYD